MSSTSQGIRRNRQFKLNRATLAIRHALALGLVLTAAQPAFAGTCDVTDPANATCDGDFVDVTIDYDIDDLTLVVGGQQPTSITPVDGARGIDLYAASGDIHLTTSADIDATDATAIMVQAPNGDIGIHATSASSITVSGAYSNATGIEARTYYGDIAIVNDGSIAVSVTGYGNATGIRASNFYGDVAVENTGAIAVGTDNVYGGTATAIRANSALGGVDVRNGGDLRADATAEYGDASAYGIIARGGYYGVTSVTNTGTIAATALTGDGVGWAWGIRARGTDVAVDNQGTITTDANAVAGYATAIASYARGYTSSTVNSGSLVASASVGNDADGDFSAARAYGAMAWGESTTMDNRGSIDARADIGYGDAVAFGVLTYYSDEAIHRNSGSIYARADAAVGTATAMGMRNQANVTGSIDNAAGGRIDAVAEAQAGYAFAYGVMTDNYTASANNAGIISASATAHASALGGTIQPLARSTGISVQASDGYGAYVVNSGDVGAISTIGDVGQAFAFGVISYGTDTGYFANTGSVSAQVDAAGGLAVGVGSVTAGAIALTINGGTITAGVQVHGDGIAQANGIYTSGEVASVFNDADAAATAHAGSGQAYATAVEVYGNWNGAFNYGSLTAAADVLVGEATAFGIDSYAVSGTTVTNSGDVTASAGAVTGDARAAAVNNFAYTYGAYVTNDGTLAAAATVQDGNALATGVVNIAFLYGQADTTNLGDIFANATVTGTGAAEAMGVYSYGFVYGPRVVNGGTIAATATAAAGSATATGVGASFYHGDALLQNDGLIVARAETLGGEFGGAYAYGVVLDHETGKYNFPNVAIVNHGDIEAVAIHGGEYGFAGATGVLTTLMGTYQHNYGGITASALATGAYGTAEATGSANLGKYAAVDINEGDITASAQAHLGGRASATGASDVSVYADATTINHGVIGAYAESVLDGAYGGIAEATALYSHANYTALVENTGTLVAHARAIDGVAEATGVTESSKYAGATLVNRGDIVAIAEGGAGYAEAMGAEVNSKYGGVVVNDGLIAARALADGGYASAVGSFSLTPGGHGYYLGAVAAALENTGTISAFAQAAGGQAHALGSRVDASNDAGARTWNEGLISALASAEGGEALAIGSRTMSYYGEVALANYGDILARADGGVGGQAFAIGGIVAVTSGSLYHAGNVVLANAGTIAASAHAVGEATAIGVQMDGETAAAAGNDGTISALADAGTGLAQAAGLVVSASAGDIAVTNAGDIVATANGGADSIGFGVHMTSTGTNTLANTGSIVANGTDGSHVAVWSSDDAIATIDNHGVIAGGIRTGSLDDTLVNHAGATLRLDDAAVDMGRHAGAGNTFANHGTIVVRGASGIDMGQGPAAATGPAPLAVPSLNPFAFVNDGVIDFRDGATDDLLTITGDLDGDGQLFMDVSGLFGTSDLLYIDGSVADGSTSTLNVHLLDMPTSADSLVTVVRVSGDSSAGSFALGNVTYAQNSFLALAFDTGLVSDIDAGNTRADEFALGVQVTGLNDTGTLATAIAPGAQSLLNTQVGTWRQRMGVIGAMARHGSNLWARYFRNDGTIAPELARSNFGDGGNFAFDQENSGTEIGADFGFTDVFSAGVLLAKAEARQALDGGGVGSTRIDGDTVGLYATVLAPGGFYLDSSYRRMQFDARVSTTGGEIHGDADAFNVELGYAWKLGNGVEIQPQFQSTWTQVASVGELSGDLAEFVLDGGDSWRSRLGVMVSRNFASGSTVWTPYATLNTVREWDGQNAYSINGDFFGATRTEGTSALVEAGLNVRAGRLSLHGGLNWQDGGALESVVGGQVNLRFSW